MLSVTIWMALASLSTIPGFARGFRADRRLVLTTRALDFRALDFPVGLRLDFLLLAAALRALAISSSRSNTSPTIRSSIASFLRVDTGYFLATRSINADMPTWAVPSSMMLSCSAISTEAKSANAASNSSRV
jgi:hypothetical protein